MRSPSALLLSALCLVLGASSLPAEPLSRKVDIDFHREVSSRNLKGLATRSDGRLVTGPTFAEIAAPAPADLLWCLEPTTDPTRFLLGTGPEGRVFEVRFNPADATYGTREIVRLDDPQVFAVRPLSDGSLLAGTSPKGNLYLIRDDKVVTRAMLPVDSIFDLLLVDDRTALVATGNPGRIYRIDLPVFARAGLGAEKLSDAKALAAYGITLFGEIRDRNVRRIAAFPDGRIVAGSAPKGNLYSFAAAGGAPVLLQENREAEVTDLLPQPNGDLYAAFVFSGTTGDTRLGGPGSRSAPAAKEPRDAAEPTLPPVQVERFSGRSSVVWFPAEGFPETLTSRANAAFYRLARHGDTLVIAGGDTGELLGYDLQARFSLTFAGSSSAQLNQLTPLPGAPGKFLVVRNNAPGLAVLDFAAEGPREAETRRIDLSTPSILGAFRFSRTREIDPAALAVEARVSHGTDEVEGWSPWTPLKLDADGGWRASGLRGRSVKLRISLPAPGSSGSAAPSASIELDRAALFHLPQNRRPTLQEFRVLSPGYGLVLAVDSPPSPVVTLSQLLQGPAGRDDDKRKSSFTGSQVVPQPGSQVVFWTVTDPDGDAFTCSFSYRRDGDERWTEVVSESRDSHAQFDTSGLPDGVYFTRLVVRETAPRPEADRLTHTFETDDLVIDHTAPELVESNATRTPQAIVLKVRGRDALSLLDNLEVTFSNGVREVLEQPLDGIRDGREETFVLDVPLPRVANATSVELTLYDAAGNKVSKRLRLQ